MSKTTLSHTFEAAQKSIEEEETVDLKVELALSFMKRALREGKKAQFKEFWRMKKLCIELFKLSIHPIKRSGYWTEYIELTTEARELQKIVEDQTNFSVEQIEMAVQALRANMEAKETELEKMPLVSFDGLVKGVEISLLQREIVFLEGFRQKILQLRKELLSLEMRVSVKNKILTDLSSLGDLVFPVRKKRMIELSDVFISEVETFVQEYFDVEHKKLRKKELCSVLRNRIKEFQSLLKKASVTNEAYRLIRKLLSSAWETVSQVDHQRRQLKSERLKEESSKLEALSEEVKAFPIDATLKGKARELQKRMMQMGLSREGTSAIRAELDAKLREFAKIEEVEANKQREEQQRKKQEKLTALEGVLENLQKSLAKGDEALSDDLQKAQEAFSKGEIDPRLHIHCNQLSLAARGALIEKNEVDEEGASALLDQALALKEDVKGEIVELREKSMNVGLDLEWAIELKSFIQKNREFLESLEEKIQQLQDTMEIG